MSEGRCGKEGDAGRAASPWRALAGRAPPARNPRRERSAMCRKALSEINAS